MAPPYFKQLPPHSATYGIEQSEKSIRDNIESIWRMVLASRGAIERSREAIAMADKALGDCNALWAPGASLQRRSNRWSLH